MQACGTGQEIVGAPDVTKKYPTTLSSSFAKDAALPTYPFPASRSTTKDVKMLTLFSVTSRHLNEVVFTQKFALPLGVRHGLDPCVDWENGGKHGWRWENVTYVPAVLALVGTWPVPMLFLGGSRHSAGRFCSG